MIDRRSLVTGGGAIAAPVLGGCSRGFPVLTDPSRGEAAIGVAAREISPVELTDALLARIAALNPALNASITQTAALARTDARALELAAALERAPGRHFRAPPSS